MPDQKPITPFMSTDPRVIPQPSDQQEPQEPQPEREEYTCRSCDGTGIGGIDRGECAPWPCTACSGSGVES